MTTPEAAARYEREHVAQYAGRKPAIFNPKELPVGELPVIYGFNNGGGSSFLSGVLLAEDGARLGGHACSSEAYMLSDLGILEGTRPDRHEGFKQYYPDGYRMEFVGYDAIPDHEGLKATIERAHNE